MDIRIKAVNPQNTKFDVFTDANTPAYLGEVTRNKLGGWKTSAAPKANYATSQEAAQSLAATAQA